jgi:nitrous oxidase accessory protein NosD
MAVNSWRVRAIVALGIAGATSLPAVAAAQTPSAACLAAGDTGLTTVVVASPGQHIHGTIDASACNVGVYVGPGVNDVVISHTTITGSKDHGIFVENASRATIVHNVLRGDVTDPNSGIAEDKAIELIGTDHSTVGWNLVTDTVGSGGIGLSDNGPVDAGAPNAGTLAASTHNLVVGNHVLNSGSDCGIVLAAYDAGSGGVIHNSVQGNVVRANVAGIVVAADLPSTVVAGDSVVGNKIKDNVLPGVIIHSNAPSDVVGHTVVAQNVLAGNGADSGAMGGNGPADPTAIILAGEVETITATRVESNAVLGNEHFGIWIGNSSGEILKGLHLDHADVPVYHYPQG